MWGSRLDTLDNRLGLSADAGLDAVTCRMESSSIVVITVLTLRFPSLRSSEIGGQDEFPGAGKFLVAVELESSCVLICFVGICGVAVALACDTTMTQAWDFGDCTFELVTCFIGAFSISSNSIFYD